MIDITDIIKMKGQELPHRVDGFWRVKFVKIENGKRFYKMVPCRRENALFVSGVCVAWSTCLLKDAKYIGPVSWSEQLIAHTRKSFANRVLEVLISEKKKSSRPKENGAHLFVWMRLQKKMDWIT